MQPGEFVIVWASNKNKRTPGLPLHANFSLSKNGEYLALVQPGGTVIEQQFAPAFPPMAANESYGLQFTTTYFVSAGAAAFLTGYQPTDVDTHTYIFTADVITQSPTGTPPTGRPVGPINRQVLDYGMDPDIVNSADPTIGGPAVVQNALKAIPTISVVCPTFLKGGTTG